MEHRKIFPRSAVQKKLKSLLQSYPTYGIIIKHDCDRYALKREVAAQKCRFFRGVCPILNRATDILGVQRQDTSIFGVSACLCCSQTFGSYTRISLDEGKSGFSLHREETPGTVFQFLNAARQLQ